MEAMEAQRYQDQRDLLIESLKSHWSKHPGYYVGSNIPICATPTQRFRGPDFFLVMDVEERERKNWIVWQEGLRFPDVIIELLSDGTKEVQERKKNFYAHLFRTTEYYLYDLSSQQFIAYRIKGRDYQEIASNADGKIYSAVTNLSLGVSDGWLRWFAGDGSLIPTPQELPE